MLPIAGCQSLGGDFVSSSEESIARYRGTLVGDNSAVGAIISGLDWENSITDFALSTDEQPYGITINQSEICDGSVCHLVDADSESNRMNAATILALVDNAEWVQIYSPVHPCPSPPQVEGETTGPQCHFEYRFERRELANQITDIQNSWNH